MSRSDYLDGILARKRREIERRLRRAEAFAKLGAALPLDPERGARAVAALRRGEGGPLRAIAEVKFRSPSAGVIRERRAGEGARVAESYVRGGASAVSVLADAPGFGGSPLEVRRVSSAVEVPVLFKEFVLDEVQIELARIVGASMVLLLVNSLDVPRLEALVREVQAKGMEPVVEAANERETEIALATGATIVGVNARNLRTFEVDPRGARRAVERIPRDRVAVFMSGMKTEDDFREVGRGRADAVLVGEGLMRLGDPAEALGRLLAASVPR
ncbi:MAG: indole-3-glycerol-phosphate synthase [Myxococcales bacterium]|nr:indole-3-glycerol-phosphate synthase [Myxococcales bacterium]